LFRDRFGVKRDIPIEGSAASRQHRWGAARAVTARSRASLGSMGVGLMLENNNTPRQLDRRTVVKGAAWAVPAVAAAVAVPFASASQSTPDCPGCLEEGVGAFTLAGVAASSRATLAFAAPVILDATNCGSLIGNIFDFKPAFTYLVTSA